MEPVTKQQIKSIYALGASLGLVDRGSRSHDDTLHQLVESISGQPSVSQLSRNDANNVISELMHRMRGFPAAPKASRRNHPETPGGVTEGQQRKIWQLMYELKKFDQNPVDAVLGDRLCGIIKRQFGIDASAKSPFRFLNYSQGNQLIEIIKKYCYNAEMRKIRAGGSL